MKVLKSRLYEQLKAEQDKEYAETAKSQVGSGDRSERIRTYNFPQGRVTDHRIGLTLYKLEAFLDGDMDEVIDAPTYADKEKEHRRLGSEMETRIFDLSREWEAGMEAGAAAIREEALRIPHGDGLWHRRGRHGPRGSGEIFRAKGRPQDNPLIVHIYDMEQAEQIAREISPMARRLMEAYWPGPFTAVVPCRGSVPREVTAGLDTVGIRMPSHPGPESCLGGAAGSLPPPAPTFPAGPAPRG